MSDHVYKKSKPRRYVSVNTTYLYGIRRDLYLDNIMTFDKTLRCSG